MNIQQASAFKIGIPIVCIGIIFDDEPTKSKKVIHAWGMFEKSSNGSFLPDQNNMEMTKYNAEPLSDTTAPKTCDCCKKDFPNEEEFIQHLKKTHGSDT